MVRGGKDSYCVSSFYISVYIARFPPALLSFIETLSIALCLPALCLCLECPYNLVRNGGAEGLRKGKKRMQCCSFLFLSHCIWRSAPLLISAVGTRRFECWEFKQRLLGRWQLWCLSCVCMFWNVKCPLKLCFQLCFSSPEDGLFLSITGFYKTQTTLCLDSGIMDYQWLSPVRMNTCSHHKSHSYIRQCTDGIKMQSDGSV